MAGVNKVIIIGNLGADPEVRYTAQGTAVANFNLATSETFTDKNGERQEKTEWHRIVVFGKTAENCGEYLHKGRQVYVEGRLQTRQWEDKEGIKRSTTEINGQTVTFLGNRGENAPAAEGGSPKREYNKPPSVESSSPRPAAARPAPAPRASGGSEKNFDYGPPPMSDDDIPF